MPPDSTNEPAQDGLVMAAHVPSSSGGTPGALCASIVLADRSGFVDRTIQELANAHLEQKTAKPFSLAAVGGYGRRELFPHSDIDLVVLVKNKEDMRSMQEPLAEFLRDVWDRGLRASHSIRTISECCRLHNRNIELNVSLLDLRMLAGNAGLFGTLSAALPDVYRKHRGQLSRDLAAMVRKRHAKFNNTVYHLEPDVKEVAGGIRDLHFLHWLQLLEMDKTPMGDGLAEIEESKRFLFAVRCAIHNLVKRDNNLLTFELQDRIAESWTLRPVDPADWMRQYYRHARLIFQSTLRGLELAEDQARRSSDRPLARHESLSTADFAVLNDRVSLADPAATLSSARATFSLFTFLATHGLKLTAETYQLVAGKNKSLTNAFREEKIPWSSWRTFLTQRHVATALRQMQETGLLTAAIPTWSAIESLVVRDFYHRYTVDEHSIVTVEVIDELSAEKSDHPVRFRNLLHEEEHLSTLRLALLLHDIGKGTRPGDHVLGSLEAADSVFEWFDVPPLQRESVRFLIEHHLDLSTVMNGRDPEDPVTARFLAARVGTQEDLRRLTLLTYADISAVNPQAMTSWRMEQLWRVYLSAQKQLTRELISDRIDHDKVSVSGTGASPELLSFLRGFPTRYLRTHSRDEIEHHLELERNRIPGGIALEIGQENGVYRLTLVAADRAGTFAALCGALASFGMNIMKAEAASNDNGCILDSIRFTDPMRTLELNPEEVIALESTISCVLGGSAQVEDLLKGRRAAIQPSAGTRIAPSVRFNNEASDECTLIDFNGEDRPGLLYDLTSALSSAGCNIELVLVDTEAHKAMDVFYVTLEGRKLNDGAQERLETALKEAADHRNGYPKLRNN